jgi:hypothetical protein
MRSVRRRDRTSADSTCERIDHGLQRLVARRARPADPDQETPELVIDISTQRPLEPSQYRHLAKLTTALKRSYREIRDLLRRQHPKLPLGERLDQVVQHHPILADHAWLLVPGSSSPAISWGCIASTLPQPVVASEVLHPIQRPHFFDRADIRSRFPCARFPATNRGWTVRLTHQSAPAALCPQAKVQRTPGRLLRRLLVAHEEASLRVHMRRGPSCEFLSRIVFGPERLAVEFRPEMPETVEFALAKAPADVADSLRWLASVGFALVGERGGPGELFGNLQLEFERAGQRAVIVRDRGQWIIDIAPADSAESYGLQALLWAMRGDKPNLGGPRRSRTSLPEQLPEGERWRVAVPAVLTWLAAADRRAEISAAAAAGRRAMEVRLGLDEPSAGAS